MNFQVGCKIVDRIHPAQGKELTSGRGFFKIFIYLWLIEGSSQYVSVEL